jgi:hypothetical protein
MEYLIKEYFPHRTTPVTRIVTDEGEQDNINTLFFTLNQAKEEGRKIAVYQLGQCVLDWS